MTPALRAPVDSRSPNLFHLSDAPAGTYDRGGLEGPHGGTWPVWHQIDNNPNGTADAVYVFAPLMVERGGGLIIVTSSTQGRHDTWNGASYSASK